MKDARTPVSSCRWWRPVAAGTLFAFCLLAYLWLFHRASGAILADLSPTCVGFLSFAAAGVLLARRGCPLMRFLPCVLAAWSVTSHRFSSATSAFPFVHGSTVGLEPSCCIGSRPDSYWLWSHPLLSAALLGALVAVPAVAAPTGWPPRHPSFSRWAAVLLVGGGGCLLFVHWVPFGSAVWLLIALTLGITNSSRRDQALSMALLTLPVFVAAALMWTFPPFDAAGWRDVGKFALSLALAGMLAGGAVNSVQDFIERSRRGSHPVQAGSAVRHPDHQ